jgi:hypothetical protein
MLQTKIAPYARWMTTDVLRGLTNPIAFIEPFVSLLFYCVKRGYLLYVSPY